MVGSTGVRLRLISAGDWSDGLGRKGSNPLPTTNFGPLAHAWLEQRTL